MQQNHSNLAKAIIGVKDFKDGEEQPLLSRGRLPFRSCIFFFTIMLPYQLSYISHYMLSMNIVCCSLKTEQWWAASPIAKRMMTLTNNRQSEAQTSLSTHKFYVPTNTKIILNVPSTYSSFIVEFVLIWLTAEHKSLLWVIELLGDKYECFDLHALPCSWMSCFVANMAGSTI